MNIFPSCLITVVFMQIILHPVFANAGNISLSDRITKNIRDICLAPCDKGKYWETNIKAGGETNVKLKLVGKASAEASFGIGEWEGVQKVLQTHQAYDNESYRNCVKQLTPLFVRKFVHTKQPAKSGKAKVVPKESKLTIKSVTPLLIYDDETKLPLKLFLLVDAFNNTNYDLYPNEVLMTGEVAQKHDIKVGNTMPKLTLEVVGTADQCLLKPHSSGTLRYYLVEFGQHSFDGYIGNSMKQETMKFTTSTPTIENLIYKADDGRLHLVEDFRNGTIRLAIDTGEEKVSISPALTMELALISSKQLDDSRFMAIFIKNSKEKFRRLMEIRKVNPKY